MPPKPASVIGDFRPQTQPIVRKASLHQLVASPVNPHLSGAHLQVHANFFRLIQRDASCFGALRAGRSKVRTAGGGEEATGAKREPAAHTQRRLKESEGSQHPWNTLIQSTSNYTARVHYILLAMRGT